MPAEGESSMAFAVVFRVEVLTEEGAEKLLVAGLKPLSTPCCQATNRCVTDV